jgi:hypothetical protein
MLQIVLPQQVLSVIIAIRRTYHRMNMLAIRCARRVTLGPQICRELMIELDQNHGTVDPIIEDAVSLSIPPIHAK